MLKPGNDAPLPPTNRIRLVPGRLNTTLDPSALGEEFAADLLNCDTSRGVWGLDSRYRRFKAHPTREYTTGGPEEYELPAVSPSSMTTVARSGGNRAFASASNATTSDNTYASASGITPGDKTDLLRATGFVPGVTIPDDATSLVAKIRVEAQVDPDTGFGTEVVDDYLKVLSGTTPVGVNEATLAAIPVTDTIIEYTVDLMALGFTPDDLMAGLLGVDFGAKAIPELSTAFDAGNWSLAYAPSSPQEVTAAPTATVNTPFDVTALYIGAGTAPDYVILNISTTALASGQGAGAPPAATNYTGTATATDGWGHSDSGTIEAPTDTYPASRTSSGSGTVRVALSGGTGSTSVGPTASSTVSGVSQEALARTTVSASVRAPDASTLKVDSILVAFVYGVDGSTTVELVGPRGIGFGSFNGSDEIEAIWGQGAFKLAAANVADPTASAWSAELSGQLLDDSDWFIWQFGRWLWATNPTDGVYYRTIGATDWTPLYKDSQSPGSTGDASAAVVKPDYDQHQVFINGTDSVTGSASGPSLSTSSPAITSDGFARIDTDNWISGSYGTGYLEFEVTLSSTRDLSKAMALAFEISVLADDGTTLGGNDGFGSSATNNKVTLTNGSGTAYGPVSPRLYGRLNKSEGTYYGWLDLSSVSSSVLSTLKKIKIRFAIYQTGRSRYRLNKLYASGTYYHDSGSLYSKSTDSESQIEYAYNYTEGATVGNAKALNVAASTHLGERPFTVESTDGGPFPYMGSVLGITVPVADSPFTSAAKINLYRKVGSNWQRISQSADNSEAHYFEDRLRDSVIAADTTTYPITTLDFSTVAPSFSGVATGVTCGVSWKGSNVYAGDDGKVYFSRTNTPTEVLWEGVVLTNDPGSDDLGPARTVTLADNTVDSAICMVAAENLYCFTPRECYVFIAGETAYTASFPRKLDGVRGALGIRAACAYGDRALVGTLDGLWLVKKASDIGNQPDELIEVTKENRGAWRTFIGSDSSGVVVRQDRGDIWCFNGSDYYHVTRDGQHILGQWADGRGVYDAVSDGVYGLLMQMTDGSVGVVGRYLTDGGLSADGSGGTAPTWSYTTARRDTTEQAVRAAVRYRSDSTTLVALEVVGENASQTLEATLTGENLVTGSLERVAPDGWRQFIVRGGARDVVVSAEVELAERKDPRRGGR